VPDKNEIMQIAEHSAHGGYYLFVGNTLSTGILAISSIIIARLLGPADYGLFSLSIVVPSILIGLIDFGITSAITRFSAKFKAEGRDSEVRRVIKTGLLFELIVGIIASLFCLIFSDLLSTYLINRPEASFYVRIASFLILFQTLLNVLSSAFIGLDRVKANALVMVIRASTKFLLSPLLIILGFGILGALLGHILCYIIAVAAGIASLGLMLYKGHGDHGSNSSIFKTMLKYGAPLYASGLLGLFSLQYQTIIIAFFATNIEVGNFQVTTLFSTAMAILTYPFIALFPAFSKLDSQNGRLGQFFRRSVKYTAILLVPASVAIAVMSKDLIYTFFGSDYNLAPTFVAFYILLNLTAGLGSAVFGYLFNGIGRTDVNLKSSLINLLIFVPLAPLLTLSYGIMGLIGSFFISGFCSLLYVLLIAFKQIKISPDIRTSAKIYLVSAISALSLFIFLTFSPFNSILNLIVGGVIFCIIYLTFLPAVGIVNFTDIEIFRLTFQKIKSLQIILKFLLQYETKILEFKQRLSKRLETRVS